MGTTEPGIRFSQSPSTDTAVTFRSVAFGIGLAILVNSVVTYSEYELHASRMNLSHFPVALLALYTIGVLIARRIGFATAELAAVLAMGLVAAAIPTSGLLGFWLGVLATPYYFATPENRWVEMFHPHIPDWFAPRDYDRTIEWFYNGVPPGESVPWTEWLIPLFWWLGLIAALILASLCLAAILRKPWVENERLVFPIAEAGMTLARTDRPGDTVPTVFRSRLFRIGFGIAFFIFAWNCLSYFNAGWPTLKLHYGQLTLFQNFVWFALRFNLLTLGLCYLANTNVLLSVWVWFLILAFQHMIFVRVGYSIGSLGDDWSSIDPMAGWEGFGALTMMVLYGLWVARGHLRMVVRAAFRGGPENDDPRELLSYRVAFFGLVGALVYIVAWLGAAGMELKMAITWLGATIVLFIGIARIVSETGLPYVRGPLTAQSFTAYGLGTANVDSSSIAILTFTYAFISQAKGLFMAPLMQVAKLSSEAKSARRVTHAVVAALVVGIVFGIVVTLVLGYAHGAFNFRDYPFSSASRHMFHLTAKYINSPLPAEWDRWQFFGIGAVVMLLVSFLRARFYWWPLSPLGLTISTTYATLNSVLMVFTAWLVKTIVLHIGGVQLYNRTKPLFLGLAAGYAVGVVFSWLVDAIWFPGAGHYVHAW
jgi:hypothetical protein